MYEFCLFALEVSLPDHGQGIAASSGKIISIFGEGTGIGAAIVAIEGILEDSLVDFPNFDLGIERSGDHEVVFGMEIHLSHWLTMGIVILDQSLTTEVIKFHLLIRRATGQTCAV
jgi:hypothetical protein